MLLCKARRKKRGVNDVLLTARCLSGVSKGLRSMPLSFSLLSPALGVKKVSVSSSSSAAAPPLAFPLRLSIEWLLCKKSPLTDER